MIDISPGSIIKLCSLSEAKQIGGTHIDPDMNKYFSNTYRISSRAPSSYNNVILEYKDTGEVLEFTDTDDDTYS